MGFIVAIDGPAGSGKGTVTKILAKKLKLNSIDTGAMYRCVTLAIIRNNIDLNDIDKFFEEESLQMADKGDKAYAIAFASKGTESERIIKGILSNKYYENIASNKKDQIHCQASY